MKTRFAINSDSLPQIILIGGPTASGKTRLAIDLAKQLDTEIINADSRQIYKEMNIGVARPSLEELAEVPHHLIASHSIHQPVNAWQFAQEARQIIDNLLLSKKHVVVCGGTGLYMDALMNGLDELPAIPRELRDELNTIAQSENGLATLVKRLEQTDSSASQWVDLQNPARVIRSIELVETTGKSLEQLRQSADTPPNPIAYSWGCFAIDLPRETLYNRINFRVDQMILDGFLGEAKALFEFKELNTLKTVGYSELFDFFEGKFELDSAIDLIKQKTRNYAKRQITWFNHHLNTQWINP
jgi:tRNA dimethylallyltransferase